jgi:hypothetical protein
MVFLMLVCFGLAQGQLTTNRVDETKLTAWDVLRRLLVPDLLVVNKSAIGKFNCARCTCLFLNLAFAWT